MQKYKKPEYDPKKIGKNPFVFQLEIPIREIEFKNQYKQDSKGDWFNVKVEAEATAFTRLYTTPTFRKLVSELSPSAKELLMWVMYEIDYGQDVLWINRDRFMLENKTSLNTFKKAINELVVKSFLAICPVKEIYYINPQYFFKGDRIAKYPNSHVNG